MSTLNVADYNPSKSKEYVQMFFMPSPKIPTSKNLNLRYTVMNPPLRKDLPSDLLQKAIHVDFDAMNQQILNNTQSVFQQEKKILQDQKNEFLVPNLDLIKFSMKEIFSRPRNKYQNSSERDFVGSYIYEKLGRSGLIITIQDFKHTIPIKAYAEFIGSPIEVSQS